MSFRLVNVVVLSAIIVDLSVESIQLTYLFSVEQTKLLIGPHLTEGIVVLTVLAMGSVFILN